MNLKFGILGSGSWGTALAKILTDNGHTINWWMRNAAGIEQFHSRKHNPHYLTSVHFDMEKLHLSDNVAQVIESSDVLVIAIPSAYAVQTLSSLPKHVFKGKKVLSAIKGILPDHDLLLNDYMTATFALDLHDYFAVLGPCHAEEVAAEKLSYLTFAGKDETFTSRIAACFRTSYIRTVLNPDIFGVQYAAILKNIYAVGAGIAHGLEYGDNFQSVFIANSADEMANFLRKAGIVNTVVGFLDHGGPEESHSALNNYTASVYLGDLLVTCYSLYSRNRTFGNMIGKGYSVKSAQLEMNMVAEGYHASRCMYNINQKVMAEMPIADTIFRILWEGLNPKQAFARIEPTLV
jgi:glycerol-3-phosphate dehydrogenase (NAD(P)+)